MTESSSPSVGDGSSIRPSPGQAIPTSAAQPGPCARTWTAIGIATVSTMVAVAALIIVFARSAAPGTHVTPALPTYTAAETAAAQQQLCDTYRLAAQAVQIDTAGTDKALARIATTNGALMLYMAAANPALDPHYRDAAHALAATYATLTAKGTYGIATDAQYQAALDDIVTKDAAMRQACANSGR
ncbi:hypothetical protein BST40_17800 [Mycobacterium persicum]|nr:hypothetical protein BST40_17800 [Mycobacterium persicum]ORC02355.1 hypothetical protein B1T48_14905 [Mycobacterium persicum]